MNEHYFITYENLETNRITTDTYSDRSFATGEISDLMSDDNVQIKSIVMVEDGELISAIEPQIIDNKVALVKAYSGTIDNTEEGLYVITYEEEDLDFEIMFSPNKEDILNFFARNQCTNTKIYDTYKVNTESCILTKTKIEIKNYKYVLTEGVE